MVPWLACSAVARGLPCAPCNEFFISSRSTLCRYRAAGRAPPDGLMPQVLEEDDEDARSSAIGSMASRRESLAPAPAPKRGPVARPSQQVRGPGRPTSCPHYAPVA